MTSTQKRLIGESVREIGVLALVFVPLDIWLEPATSYTSIHGIAYPWYLRWVAFLSPHYWLAIFFAAAGLALIYFGVKIESQAIQELTELGMT